MKMVNEDPYNFFQSGGWNFLPGPTQGNVSTSQIVATGFLIYSLLRAIQSLLLLNQCSKLKMTHLKSQKVAVTEVLMMVPMLVTMKEVVPLLTRRAKVKYFSSHYLHTTYIFPGEDWEELEKKAAKSDKKRHEKGEADSEDSDDGRSKKKSQSKKPNGKSRR
jgi:hypothetical protein